MNIGFMLPSTYSVGSLYNGVREQAVFQANALEELGHNVIRLDPWFKYEIEELDVVQFFQGGPAMHAIEITAEDRPYKLVFAPIIDADMPNWRFRMASEIGRLHPKLRSIQSYYAIQAKYSDAVVARSEHERSKLIDGLGTDPSKIEIVLNGCPEPRLVNPDYARTKFGLADDFILHISKYSNTNKNVLNLIKAIGPTGKQLVIGGTYDNNNNKAEIDSESKKYSNIKFIGRIDDELRDSLYAACRVFCLPSFREGTGLVAVEAASYGASVVITSRGGPPDYFKEHASYVNGTTVEEIRNVLGQAWEIGRTNEICKEHVIANLTWRSSAESLVCLYENLING